MSKGSSVYDAHKKWLIFFPYPSPTTPPHPPSAKINSKCQVSRPPTPFPCGRHKRMVTKTKTNFWKKTYYYWKKRYQLQALVCVEFIIVKKICISFCCFFFKKRFVWNSAIIIRKHQVADPSLPPPAGVLQRPSSV